MQRIFRILTAILFALPSFAFADSLSAEAFLAGDIHLISLSKINRDPEFNMVYVPLLSNFSSERVHGASGTVYRSITALGMIDCSKKTFTTVDHRFHEKVAGEGLVLAYDAEAPNKLTWLPIKEEIKAKDLYEILRGYCNKDEN